MMLSSLRQSACRAVPRYSRTFFGGGSTSSSNNASSILDEANDVFAGTPPAPPPLTPTPTPTASSKTTSIPLYYDIPPEKDPLLQLLTTKIMRHGRYSTAQKIISDTLLNVHTLTRSPPLPIVHEAIFKASPAVRTLQHKSGGRTTAKPMALSERQRASKGIEWILEASKKKPGIKLQVRLAKELIAVLRGDSPALKKKEDAHKLAMVSRGSLPKTRQ